MQARHREFGGEVVENCHCDAEVPLRVLEVDGIHLVGHCRRAYFPLFGLLLEIFHRDVLPEVAVEVDYNGADALHRIEKRREIVVVGNLRGELLALDAQALREKRIGKPEPVDFWIGDAVCVEVACGAAEFAAHGRGFEQRELLLEAIGKHTRLLAQASGRCRLSVGARKHRNIFPFIGISVEARNHLLDLRDNHIVERILDAHGQRCVVDVLRGEPEMDKFEILVQPERLEALFDEIFHRLHIVVGYTLDFLDALGIVGGKLGVETTKLGKMRVVKSLELWQRKLAQSNEILDFHLYTVAHKRKFREIFRKSGSLAIVAAIDGRHRSECR